MNSKAVEISRKLRETRSLDGYRDADILHSSSRRAGPCESASLHSCTGGSAPRPALSAVDILCNKIAPNDLYGNLAGIYTRAIPRAAPGCVHASSGADGALHALRYLSCRGPTIVQDSRSFSTGAFVYFATQYMYNVHYDNRQAGHLLSALRLER